MSDICTCVYLTSLNFRFYTNLISASKPNTH